MIFLCNVRQEICILPQSNAVFGKGPVCGPFMSLTHARCVSQLWEAESQIQECHAWKIRLSTQLLPYRARLL